MPDSREAPGPFGPTVTLLFSDIRGFTEFTEQHGDEVAYQLLQAHHAAVRREIAAYGGTVVKTQGDSVMVVFPTARGAVLCAVAIQQASAAADRDRPGTRIAVGIGIATGEPIQQDGDFFGSTVNLAARLCAEAGPGQILVAETTRHVAGRLEGIAYVDRGPWELKGFIEPQRVFEVRWSPAPPPDVPADDGAALESAVQRALGVLARVLALRHRDDATFRPLLECQARAGELRLELSRALAERQGYTVRRVDEAMLPYADLLALVEGREPLDDQRWAQLEASVARAFGRPLAVAATRGRLVVDATPGRPDAPAPAPAQPGAPAPAAAPVRPDDRAPAPDPRAAGVAWWTAAHRAWLAWKASGMAWAHALRAALARHPHLLAVPIPESAAWDEGRLAESYFALLEHVEGRAPAFLRGAVARAVELAGGEDPARLGPALYGLLVARGRLPETYGDFVRDVMVATIPHPGPWTDGVVVETDEATTVRRRPTGTPGEASEQAEVLTQPTARAEAQRFAVRVAPLTARFYVVHAGVLKAPREVVVRLTSGGAPSDRAWYLTIRTGHMLHTEPRRLRAGGETIAGLGRDVAGVWVGVFNPDPEAAAEAELTLAVRAPASTPPRAAPFAPPGRRPR